MTKFVAAFALIALPLSAVAEDHEMVNARHIINVKLSMSDTESWRFTGSLKEGGDTLGCDMIVANNEDKSTTVTINSNQGRTIAVTIKNEINAFVDGDSIRVNVMDGEQLNIDSSAKAIDDDAIFVKASLKNAGGEEVRCDVLVDKSY